MTSLEHDSAVGVEMEQEGQRFSLIDDAVNAANLKTKAFKLEKKKSKELLLQLMKKNKRNNFRLRNGKLLELKIKPKTKAIHWNWVKQHLTTYYEEFQKQTSFFANETAAEIVLYLQEKKKQETELVELITEKKNKDSNSTLMNQVYK